MRKSKADFQELVWLHSWALMFPLPNINYLTGHQPHTRPPRDCDKMWRRPQYYFVIVPKHWQKTLRTKKIPTFPLSQLKWMIPAALPIPALAPLCSSLPGKIKIHNHRIPCISWQHPNQSKAPLSGNFPQINTNSNSTVLSNFLFLRHPVPLWSVLSFVVTCDKSSFT